MSKTESFKIIKDYYAAFNRADFSGMLALMSEDVVHDINQGDREGGKAAFTHFLEQMDIHYSESAQDLQIMINDDGSRGAAEFVIEGTYKKTATGLPKANGQKYSLPVGAFFEIRQAKICRVSNYYNLNDWIAQVSR